MLFNKFYTIPKELTNGKSKVVVKFISAKEKIAGKIFGVRIATKGKL